MNQNDYYDDTFVLYLRGFKPNGVLGAILKGQNVIFKISLN